MATLPHDVEDPYFAPVVLALDAEIEELGQLDVNELARRVAQLGDFADWTGDLRAIGLLQTIRYLVDCRNWELAWDLRGLRVTHGPHSAVLGIPATFSQYLSGSFIAPSREAQLDDAR